MRREGQERGRESVSGPACHHRVRSEASDKELGFPGGSVTLVLRKLHRDGLSSRQIIERLERAGLEPKNGGRWHPKVVLEICQRSGQ